MSEPYEPHLKRCYWCDAEVEEEFYDSDKRACEDCIAVDKIPKITSNSTPGLST